MACTDGFNNRSKNLKTTGVGSPIRPQSANAYEHFTNETGLKHPRNLFGERQSANTLSSSSIQPDTRPTVIHFEDDEIAKFGKNAVVNLTNGRFNHLMIDLASLKRTREGNWHGTTPGGTIYSEAWGVESVTIQAYDMERDELDSIELPRTELEWLVEKFAPVYTYEPDPSLLRGIDKKLAGPFITDRKNESGEPHTREARERSYPPYAPSHLVSPEPFISIETRSGDAVYLIKQNEDKALVKINAWDDRKLTAAVYIELGVLMAAQDGVDARRLWSNERVYAVRWEGDQATISDFVELEHCCDDGCPPDCQRSFDRVDERAVTVSRDELNWIVKSYQALADEE